MRAARRTPRCCCRGTPFEHGGGAIESLESDTIGASRRSRAGDFHGQTTRILAVREPPFRLLFTGSTIPAIGAQVTRVALPWLVSQLTGDPAQLGLVLGVMALPRALFMLVGGAVVDRMSARRMLLNARAVNAVPIGVLAAPVLVGGMRMWMLYALAPGIGLATVFADPAGSSLVPQLVEPEQRHAANSVFMGMRQLSLLIGPALAGLLIRVGSGAATTHGARDTGIAFAIDALSFLCSVGSLSMIRVSSDRHPWAPAGSIFAKLIEGIRALWRDQQMRALVGYFAAGSVLLSGPLQVALPVLARTRLAPGAAAFGILMTANASGMLVGSVACGAVTRLTRGSLGMLLLCTDTCVSLVVAAMGEVHSLAAGAGIMVLTGMVGGTIQISLMTRLQRRVPQALMGRTMSIVIFTFLRMAPLAAALAGGLLKVRLLTELLMGAGLSLSVIALCSLTRPSMRAIRLASAAAPAGE